MLPPLTSLPSWIESMPLSAPASPTKITLTPAAFMRVSWTLGVKSRPPARPTTPPTMMSATLMIVPSPTTMPPVRAGPAARTAGPKVPLRPRSRPWGGSAGLSHRSRWRGRLWGAGWVWAKACGRPVRAAGDRVRAVGWHESLGGGLRAATARRCGGDKRDAHGARVLGEVVAARRTDLQSHMGMLAREGGEHVGQERRRDGLDAADAQRPP